MQRIRVAALRTEFDVSRTALGEEEHGWERFEGQILFGPLLLIAVGTEFHKLDSFRRQVLRGVFVATLHALAKFAPRRVQDSDGSFGVRSFILKLFDVSARERVNFAVFEKVFFRCFTRILCGLSFGAQVTAV